MRTDLHSARLRSARSVVFLHENPRQMGGGERMLLHIAGIASRNANVYFVDLFGNGELLEPEWAAGFNDVTQFDFPPRLGIGSAPKLLMELRALRAYLRRLDGPVCIAFSHPAAFRMAVAFPGAGTGLLWFCDFPLEVHRRRMLTVRTIARAGTVAVCPSRFMADNLAALGFPTRQIQVVYNAIDVERFEGNQTDAATQQALRRRLGLPDADLLVACVARIDPVKNHIVLLRALNISRREGVHVALVCVGDAEPVHRDHAEKLRTEAQALGVADQVHWVGRQEDVAPWLRASDACVVASHAEAGTPLALLEAGAAALPLIATGTGSAEIVFPGRTGLLFEPDDPEGCAAVMLQLARNPADRRRFGLEAQRRVRASFGLERLTEEWQEIFARLGELELD